MDRERNFVDVVVSEVHKTIRDAERNVKNEWYAAKWEARVSDEWSKLVRGVPSQMSDLAADGSFLMRYISAYGIKGFSFCIALGGSIVAVFGLGDTPIDYEDVSVGLIMVVASQLAFWAGHAVQKSADQRRDAKDQNRLLRLARYRGGSLTVIEATTDLRLPIDKTEAILRELAARGHAEVRVSESGMIVYHFIELEFADEKHRAKQVDEL